MFRIFPHIGHFPHYFKKHLPLQLEELYLASAIMDFAVAAITLFEPIYLWTLGYTISDLLFFYLLCYAAYYFLVPLGGKFVSHFGHEKSILISTVCLVGYYAALIGIQANSTLFYVAPFIFSLQKTFYWPAYHFDFMRFAVKEERASEFSGLWSITTLMYVLGPIGGGVIVSMFGFPSLFMTASVMILLSSIPLFISRPPVKSEPFSYWKSFTLPWRRRYWRNTIGYLGLGQELIWLVVWPVFVFIIFGSIFDTGLLVGFSAFLTAIVTLIIGRWTDRHAKNHLSAVAGIVSAGVWLGRLMLRSTPGVFILDLFGRISENTLTVGTTAMTYDRSHDDDYSWHAVYYEQGFALGKCLMAALGLLLASIFNPFATTFILAALFSLFYLVL